MRYYFMDFENVNMDGFKGLEVTCPESVIYVIYTETCKNISLDVLEQIDRLGIKMIAHKAMTGSKNALDFQLSSLLGYTIGKNEDHPDQEYIIISRDTGYDVVVDFWRNKNVAVSRFCNLSGETDKVENRKEEREEYKKDAAVSQKTVKENKKDTKTKQREPDTTQEIVRTKQKVAGTAKMPTIATQQTTKDELLHYIPKDEFSDHVLHIVNQYKTKQEINRSLSKLYRNSQKSGALYKKLKPLFKEKSIK